MAYFNNIFDAAPFVLAMLQNDYFGNFSERDQVEDPYCVYAIEADMEEPLDDEGRFWDAEQREALQLFADATPDLRRRALAEGREYCKFQFGASLVR